MAVLSILGVPWAFVLCRSLPSRGVLLAAPVGLFLAHYLAWLGLSTGFFPNGRGVAVAALLTFAALSAALAWRLSPSLVGLRSNRRLWSAGCLLLLAMFAVGVGLRWLNPEIGGTEKPMDFALLNAAARATAFPPPDPWFAGETVNYYYLGYSMAAFGMHLSGADPAVGYNLAVAALFALGALAAASAGYDLAVLTGAGKRARKVAAALALGLTMLAGNLAVLRVIFSDSTDTPTGFWQGIGWNASRTIQREDASGLTDYTINEFPAFSFILGDLHPHVMALPFTLLAVSLAVQWILAGVESEREALAPRLARGALTGLVLGGLYALNAWDAPTFAGLVLAGGVVVAWRDRRRLLALAPPAAAALFVGIVAWLPYTLNYVPGSRAIGVVTVRSEALDYFQVFGLLLTAAVVTLAALLWDVRPDGRLFLIVLLAAGAGATVIARGDIVVGLAALLILSSLRAPVAPHRAWAGGAPVAAGGRTRVVDRRRGAIRGRLLRFAQPTHEHRLQTALPGLGPAGYCRRTRTHPDLAPSHATRRSPPEADAHGLRERARVTGHSRAGLPAHRHRRQDRRQSGLRIVGRPRRRPPAPPL